MTGFLTLLALLLSGALLSGGETAIPFDLETVNLVHAEKRGQTLTADPAGGLRLELNEGVFAFGEAHCKQDIPLGDCREGEILLKLGLDDPETLQSVGLRLRDAQGEIFQFPSAGTVFVKGENLLRFPFRDGLQRGSWGNPKVVNKKIDWPLRFSGFSIRLKKGGGVRRILIGGVGFLPGGGREEVSTAPLLFFDDRSKFTVTGADAQSTPEGLLLSANNRNVTLREYKLPMRGVAAPLRLTLSGNVRRGEGTIRLLYQDGDGKEQTLETPFRPGDTEFGLAFPAGTSSATIRQFEFRGKTAEFELLLAAAKLTRSVPAAEALLFDVETGNPLHILREGEEDKLRLTLTNSSDRPLSGNAEFSFLDFFGNRKTEAAAFSLAPGETLRHRPAAIDRFGIVTVEAKLSETESKSTAFRQLTFARLRPAGPTPLEETGEFLFGVCTHTPRWALRDQLLEAEAAAFSGAKIVRGALPEWSSIQPEPDRWNFAEYDRLLELFRSRGVGVQGKFYFTPRWAAPPEVREASDWRDWNRAAPNLAAWRTFVRTLAARYRGKVNYWETWNEPDLYGFARFDATKYVELQKAAFEEVRKAAPEAKVMTAGFATLRPFGRKERDNARYIREALAGVRGFCDLVAYHEHGAFPIYVRSVDELLLPAMREAGLTVGWYSNETGISSTGGMEHFQAEMVYKKMLFAWSRRAAAYNWYDLRNDGFAPYNSEHHYGLMTADFYPKPSFAAYTALTWTYRGAHFLKQLPAAPGVWLLLFQQDGNLLLAGWDENAQTAGVPLLIASDARSAERIDLMGNAAPAAQFGSMTLFALDRHPATLRLERAAKAENAGPLFTVAAPDAVAPGQEFPVRVAFTNSFDREVGGELELRGGRHCSPETQTRKFRALPGAMAEAVFSLKSAADMPAEFGSRIAAPLACRFTGIDCAATFELTIQSALPVSAKPFDGREPDFRLNRKAQAFSFHEAQPDMVHRLWKGEDDLSAEIRIGVTSDALKLRVLVRDDIHCQPESGRQLWKGDGIQFALLFPGQEGMWELGLARLDSGKPDAFGWLAPTGFDPEKTARQIRLATARDGTLTRYDAEIPFDALGVTAETLAKGFRFNLLVNENDGDGRDGWIELAPGLGSGKNPVRYPALVLTR